MIESKENTKDVLLAPRETFRFACRPDLACFNSCCRDKRLPVWPYDLLRLKRSLNLPAPELLERYAILEFDPVSGWPALRLKLGDDGRCPFITKQGCLVYADRPAACRVYPLSKTVAKGSDGLTSFQFFRMETKTCLGWAQDQPHTTSSWIEDQGLAGYNRFDELLLPLFLHPKRKGRIDPSPAQIHAIIAALYNPDVFRQMIGSREFQKESPLERIKNALADDEELLLLGRDFLLAKLFGEIERLS